MQNNESPSNIDDGQQKGHSSSGKLTRDDWQHIISEWKASSLTQKSFCAARGVSFHTFAYYRNVFIQEARTDPKIVPIQVTKQVTTSQSSRDPFVLHLPSGAKLAIPHSYNSTALKALLNALEVC